MTPSENRKVAYTKQAIRSAFISLLQERPVEKISVTALCAAADINRTTFYRYYLDIPDLMERIEDEHYRMLYDSTLKNLHIQANMGALPSQIRCSVLNALKADTDFYRIILADRDNHLLMRILRDTYRFMQTEYAPLASRESYCKVELTDYERDSAIRCLISGSVSVVRHWLETGCQESVAEVDAVLSKLSRCISRNFWYPDDKL